MRLSGGSLRNRVLKAPSSAGVRPTPGRVKEALFSILGDTIALGRVLDLYAGTGAVGFEALSRGAGEAVFVERNAHQARSIRDAARSLALEGRTTVLIMDAERAARTVGGHFDLVYADPPYAMPPPAGAFTVLRERSRVDARSTLVYERRSGKDSTPLVAAGFETVREERYGEVTLQFLHVRA